MDIKISLDLGSDTLKVAYAYSYLGKDYYGKLTPESYDGISAQPFPAVAFFHEEENKWYFADEVDSVKSNSYFNTVKIKSLLSLLSDFGSKETNEINRLFYGTSNHFPKFHFPLRRMVLKDYKKMIELNLTFEAKKYTPKSVCSLYFDYIYAQVMKRLNLMLEERNIKGNVKIDLAIVYPTKSNIEYIEELKRLVENSFNQKVKTVQSSNRCLCQFAAYLGMINHGEKVLMFDMGEEDISVAKVYLASENSHETGIAIDGQDGHSDPIEIGGNDIDEAIARKIEKTIQAREIPGTPSHGELGHIVEKGLNAKQYLFVKNIKMAKTYFSRMDDEPMLANVFSDGIPIDIHREVYIQTCITKKNVLDWIGVTDNSGIMKQIVDYVKTEVDMPVNYDVTKILLSGGLAETIGLVDCISSSLPKKLQTLSFNYGTQSYDQYHVQIYEDSIYAAALGGALIALKDYKILIALTLSYGTFFYDDSSPKRRYLKILVDKGTILPKNGAEFLTWGTISGPSVEQELLSTHLTQSEISRRPKSELTSTDELVIHDPGKAARREVQKKVGLKVISGSELNNAMNICFYVKNYGRYEQIVIKESIYFIEGIKIDSDGRIKPFIRTVSDSDHDILYNYFVESEGMSYYKAEERTSGFIKHNNQYIAVSYVDSNETFSVKGSDIYIGYENIQENLSISQDDSYGE